MDNLEKRDTISMIAHELRTSLIADKWVLKMLHDEDLGSLNEQQKNLLEKALKNNQKMIELITELVETGHSVQSVPLAFEKINISNLVHEVMHDFDAEAHKKNLSLSYKSPDTDIFAEVNENKIHSAVQELINNAIKYTEKGGVSINIETTAHNTCKIIVQDSGIGIPEEEKVKVIEKFFRGQEARKREEIGSGLGLFAVEKIAEKHGGKLYFTSEHGKGSVFTIEFPLKHND